MKEKNMLRLMLSILFTTFILVSPSYAFNNSMYAKIPSYYTVGGTYVSWDGASCTSGWDIEPTNPSNVVDNDFNVADTVGRLYGRSGLNIHCGGVLFDLNNSYSIDALKIKYLTSDWTWIRIEKSTDNVTWSLLQDYTQQTGVQNLSYSSVTMRLLRINFSNTATGYRDTYRYEVQALVSDFNPTKPIISFPINNSRHSSINYTWNQSTDLDGDEVIYDFWLSSQSDFSDTVNRTNFTNNWTGTIITPDGVNYGKVRAYDSYNYSDWSNIIQFTDNIAPSVVNITLSPSTPSITDNLTTSMNGTDAEGDTLTKYYRWYKNGVLNNSWNDSTYINYTNNYSSGDTIYVRGFVNDGYENSSELQSSSVIIGSSNSAPTLSGITLNPSTKKYNKTITVNTSSNITDTESTMVRLQVYRYVSGVKSYLGNSSWVAPPNNASVNITIPWSDGIAYTIYAQAQDNGNATQDNTTNLTSSEVSATFTSDITAPTVNSSSVSPSSVTTGNDVTITITADGKGANISSANVTVTRPDYTTVTLDLTCTYTSGDNSTCTRSYTANSGVGTYSVDSFGLADDSNNTAMPSSTLTFTATAASSGSTGGGGGGGGTTIIYKDKEEDNATAAIPLLRLKNITSGATEPQLQEIADCLTQSLFMENKCSGYNYGVVVEPMNWWVFAGAFLASFGVVVGRGIHQDKAREWFTEPLLYSTTTTLVLIVLVSVGINMYLFNYLADSPKYAWTFASTALWGGIVALVWDNYYYGKKKYTILRST